MYVCVIVLDAGAGTLCGEHVLMSIEVHCPAIPLFLLHTHNNTHTYNHTHTQIAIFNVCWESSRTLFDINMAIGMEPHGNRLGSIKLSEGVLRFAITPIHKSSTFSILTHWLLGNGVKYFFWEDAYMLRRINVVLYQLHSTTNIKVYVNAPTQIHTHSCKKNAALCVLTVFYFHLKSKIADSSLKSRI